MLVNILGSMVPLNVKYILSVGKVIGITLKSRADLPEQRRVYFIHLARMWLFVLPPEY